MLEIPTTIYREIDDKTNPDKLNANTRKANARYDFYKDLRGNRTRRLGIIISGLLLATAARLAALGALSALLGALALRAATAAF